MSEIIKIPVSDVVFREDVYPRIKHDPVTVQKYAEDLEVLPAIEVNQHKEIIDGWHRWTAHKKAKAEYIDVAITQTNSDCHLLELAIQRNASHGLQLSQDDKRSMARRIYHLTPERERDTKKRELAALLSVSERTVRGWLSNIDKDAREDRKRRIFDAWLSCHTQEEIAEQENVTKSVVNEICSEMANLPEANKPVASHLVDFTPPLYNVWTFQKKTNNVSHFGNSEVTIVDNLLYLYTQPFEIVLDPFAGGGSTIDICKKRFRRYWVSDRLPIPEREHEIRRWDITDGPPPVPRWKDVRLVYLDPPYWKQAESQYSTDESDLANMSLDEFNRSLSGLVNALSKKLHAGSHIALLIQPTQWRAPDKQYTDHVADMLRSVDLPISMRVQCPYQSEQCTPQMVEWAKANRQLLVLSRELVIWEIL
ncbi:MAG: ParB N-terminal domain-containing protein [Desulfomonile tiedjei]|nr:ParB N-terminal domain-containing protein [Desulfomonile tiedjei]